MYLVVSSGPTGGVDDPLYLRRTDGVHVPVVHGERAALIACDRRTTRVECFARAVDPQVVPAGSRLPAHLVRLLRGGSVYDDSPAAKGVVVDSGVPRVCASGSAWPTFPWPL